MKRFLLAHILNATQIVMESGGLSYCIITQWKAEGKGGSMRRLYLPFSCNISPMRAAVDSNHLFKVLYFYTVTIMTQFQNFEETNLNTQLTHVNE